MPSANTLFLVAFVASILSALGAAVGIPGVSPHVNAVFAILGVVGTAISGFLAKSPWPHPAEAPLSVVNPPVTPVTPVPPQGAIKG